MFGVKSITLSRVENKATQDLGSVELFDTTMKRKFPG